MPAWYEPFARQLALWNRRRLYRRQAARMPRYTDWVARFDTPGPHERSALLKRLEALATRPQVALLLWAGQDRPHRYRPLLASLAAQLYPCWQLKIGVDAGVDAEWRAEIEAQARLCVVPAGSRAELQAAACAPWLAWLDTGETWREHTLLLLVEAALARDAVRLVYADEDRLDAGGARSEPQFKCDWNPWLLLSHDYVGSPALFRTDCVPPSADGADWRHRMVLHGSRRGGTGVVVHVPHVLCHVESAVAAARQTASAQAVQAELDAQGVNASARTEGLHGVRVRFALPDPAPSVTIVIPTRNGLTLLRQCVDSILQRTRYADYDIAIVDNGSDDAQCLRWLERIAAAEPRVSVRRDDRPFNFASLNNTAIEQARGEFVALVNNDIEVIDPDWLTEMVGLAAQPGVGAVGARLWYGDGTLQHGGVIVGIGGGAGHAHKRLRRHEPGMMGRAQRLQALSAVTAACMVIRRATYCAVGGMDAEHFAVAFNDVDLCLRLRAQGLSNLWTPHAELYHHESVTRGADHRPAKKERFLRERAELQRRWAPLLRHDPAYNPNLTLEHENSALAWPPRVSLLRPWFLDEPDHDHTPS